MAVVASVAVVLIVVLGFIGLGAPNRQRAMRADLQRVTGLYQLSTAIQNYWAGHESTLPTGLDQLPMRPSDPITHQPYVYRALAGSNYELCADFAGSGGDGQGSAGDNERTHPAGMHCFKLDATVPTNFPGIYPAD
jgi:hypothetical protein